MWTFPNVQILGQYLTSSLKLWLHVQFLNAARIAGNSKVILAKIAHVTIALRHRQTPVGGQHVKAQSAIW